MLELLYGNFQHKNSESGKEWGLREQWTWWTLIVKLNLTMLIDK